MEALIVQRQRERNPRLRVGAAVAPRQGEGFECTLDVVLECIAFPGTTTRCIQAAVVDRAGTVELRER